MWPKGSFEKYLFYVLGLGNLSKHPSGYFRLQFEDPRDTRTLMEIAKTGIPRKMISIHSMILEGLVKEYEKQHKNGEYTDIIL